jgi:hypothetical protein
MDKQKIQLEINAYLNKHNITDETIRSVFSSGAVWALLSLEISHLREQIGNKHE